MVNSIETSSAGARWTQFLGKFLWSLGTSQANNIHKVLRALYAVRVPLVAAVNGPAIGLGCDLACLGDIRIASASLKYGFPIGVAQEAIEKGAHVHVHNIASNYTPTHTLPDAT